jgi:hypothetical protein
LGIEFKEPQLFDYLKENYYSDLEKSEEFDNWDCISLFWQQVLDHLRLGILTPHLMVCGALT